MNQANPRLNSATAGFSLSASTFAFVGVSLIVSLIFWLSGMQEESDAYKYISYLASPIAIASGCLITLTVRKQNLADVAPLNCHWKYYIIALLMVFGLLFCVSEINTVTLEFLKLLGYTPRAESSYIPSLGGGRIIPALLVIAVLPAIFEELLFRGVILQNARSSMGDISAIFIVGFSFALFHGSAEQTVYQFICGCAFALIAVCSGSVLPGVMMHFINNALLILMYAYVPMDAEGNMFSPAVRITLIVIGAIAFISSIVWLLLDRKPFIKGEKGGVVAFFKYAWAGIMVLGIIWILSWVVV